MTQDNANSPGAHQDDGQAEFKEQTENQFSDQPEGREVEEFFQRLPGNLRWPKPDAEAVAAAVEAIHRMSGGGAGYASAEPGTEAKNGGDGTENISCSSCGGMLPVNARFCVWCGIPTHRAGSETTVSSVPAAAQHHFHHHYHHLVPAQANAASGATSAESPTSTPRGRAPGAATTTGGRAEAAARELLRDWVQACNTRHIDDLLELYTPDATVLRSSVPPVRSLPAIREFLVSLLEAGLGDVEMESLRLEIMGDIALDLGRCKMLVPVAMGKRREERGKYLVVLVRQPAGNWKIFADCWSSDLPVSAPPEAAGRKASEPMPPIRKPR